MQRSSYLAATVFAFAMAFGGIAFGQGATPNRPLSDILRTLEAQGDVVRFDEIEWDDGVWEIEYVSRSGGKRTVRLNPATGEIVR